jgi:hypothetical protein
MLASNRCSTFTFFAMSSAKPKMNAGRPASKNIPMTDFNSAGAFNQATHKAATMAKHTYSRCACGMKLLNTFIGIHAQSTVPGFG